MRQKCHLHGYPRRADARRCECQQPLSVAARAHMHSPRPTTSPEHRQMRFPRAPAHYPAIPATDPADFPCLSTTTLASAPRRCECQQPLSVAARAHMHSPRPTTSPDRPQVRFPRAPAHYPSIPATDPTDFAHVLAPPPQPSAPAKTQPRTNRAAAGHAARVCAAPTDTTNPPATDGPILSPSARAPAPAAQPNAHVLAPPPRPCPPGKTPPAMKQGKLWQAVCVCAALTDATNPPATDKPTPHP